MKKVLLNVLKMIGRYLGVVLIFTVILTSLSILASGFIFKEVLNYKEKVLAEFDIENYEYQPALTTEIYSKNGTLLAEIYDEKRKYLPYNDIPDVVKDALISVEDRRFYRHHGVDPQGALRALASNFSSGDSTGQGASTLTMQISRQLFLSLEKTWDRKIKEIFIALELEGKFDKNTILEMYLNEVFFGQGAYGIESASQTFFGKSAKDLTIEEATLLVGLPQSPSSYNPKGKNGPDRAYKRRLAVLDSMVMEELITKEEAKEIAETELEFYKGETDSKRVNNMIYPYFTSWAISELEKEYGRKVYSSGWKIYTTIDDTAQELAIKTATEQSKLYKSWYNFNDIAITTINPQTGELIAMTSGDGKKFKENQINMSTRPRQPGSTMKPLVYAVGIEKGVISDSSIFLDEPIDINGYKPGNHDNRHRGYMTTRDALKFSNNVISVKVAQRTKIENVKHYLEKMGVSTLTDQDNNLGMAIGGMAKGISPYEMAIAYGVLANDGKLVEPHFVSRIEDSKGNVVLDKKPITEQILQESTSELITDMLRDVVSGGYSSPARINRESAGKTGTTNGFLDLWYVGYVPNAVTSVWIGNSDNTKPKGSMSSGRTAGTTFQKYMNQYIKHIPNVSFKPKAQLKYYNLAIKSEDEVFLAGKYCGSSRGLTFKSFLLQPQFAPSDSMNCEPVDLGQYFKDALNEGKTIQDLLDEGYYKELVTHGYIQALVDAGMFDKLASDGYIDELKKAGYEEQLISGGYIDPPKPEEPEPDPEEKKPVDNTPKPPVQNPPTNNNGGNGNNNSGNNNDNSSSGGGSGNETPKPPTQEEEGQDEGDGTSVGESVSP